jgi:transposase
MATMTWVGLDVHARSIEAAALDARSGELARRRFGGESAPVVAWLRGLAAPVSACYEAGPTGYGLYRAAREADVAVAVVAPSKTPRGPGDRVKTDRKDAELLVRLLSAGALTPISVPTPAFEAARDLSRAREQVRGDLLRARQRTSKLLLRRGRLWDPARSTWTAGHRRWLDGQRFDAEPTELAYRDGLAAIDALAARKAALDEQLSRLAEDPLFWPTVARLRCFRGLDTLGALVVPLEVHDWQRFRRPCELGAWLGLTPSLEQSGQSARSGSITKTGSGYGRRILVEAAKHAGRPPRIGADLARRQEGQPDAVKAIAWKAQRRLYRLSSHLRKRGKPANVVAVAAARELASFLWAAATIE